MADTATLYLPIDRRHALVRGDSLPETAEGSTLFADISGFTTLTELLARELGPRRGAEQLTVYLNEVYDALIAHVHSFGGSVTGFAGDGITCWFSGDDGRRAVASGLAMQQAMERFSCLTVSGSDEPTICLSAKVAVAAGPVRRFVVGDPDHLLLDVLAGATLERLAAAEHQAHTGEIVVDGDTADRLGDLLSISDWRVEPGSGGRFAVVDGLRDMPPETPWPPLPPDALADADVRSWLLAPIFQRLQSGQGEYLAELRPAVILFLRFEGIDYVGDPAAGRQLDAFIGEVQKVLHRFDGSLVQLTIGDKGSFLYAAFGAPVAHEDDADRALATALALQQLPARFPYLHPFQIGVTRGRTRVGAYGSTLRRTYGVLGDAVNLAARLMMVAEPGEILVSDEAREHAGPLFVWESLPAVQVKGKRDPVPLNRLVRARQRRPGQILQAAFPLPPVGRTETRARLQEALSALPDGHGQLVRLIGDAGMGKSHLAAHLAQEAQAAGARVAASAAQSVARTTPYLPWRQIFYDLLELQERDEAAAVDWLRRHLEQDQPQWLLRLPLLGDLLNLPIEDNPATAALESEVRQEALFSLLVEMIVAAAHRQPLLLIVDNAQWMDEASAGLTNALARRAVSASPVLLLLVQRPIGTDEPHVLPELDELPYATTLSLAELDETAVRALVERRLEGRPSALLVSVVQQTARGNPFFVGELLAALQEGGQIVCGPDGRWDIGGALLDQLQRANAVRQSDGEWCLESGVDFTRVPLGLPDSIHGLILSRLDRLGESQKMTLKVCSVAGNPIRLLLVAGAHPEGRTLADIRADAVALDVQGVLRAEDPARDAYAFRHHSTQEVVYETLLYQQRQQLHRAVAGVLAQDVPDAVSAIAYHAYLGQLWPLALHYNLAAGEQAKQLHANQQAIDLLQKALHSSEQLPEAETQEQRKRLHLALGELFVITGRHDDGIQHLHTALALARAQGDREAEARAHRLRARSYEQRSDYTAALWAIDEGLAALDGELSPEAAHLSLIAGLIHTRQGRYAEALALCRHSLEVAEQLDDREIKARTYSLMGIIALRSDSAAAVTRVHQALAYYEELGDTYGQATAHNLIANGHFARGAWSTADRHYRKALGLFTQIGTVYNQVLVNNNLGGIALKQGRLDEALDYYRRAARLLELSGGSLWVLGALYLNMGNVSLQQDELQTAGEQLQLARSYLDRAQARDLLPELLGLFAELALRRGDLEEAGRYCEESLALAREINLPRDEGHSLRIKGEIALAQKLYDEAESYLLESCRLLQEAGDEYEGARTRFSLASLYLLTGEGAEAERELALAEKVFRRLEARLDLEKAIALREQINPVRRSP